MGIENPVHIIFIAAVALIVLGPRRLPELARRLGEGVREFRAAIETGSEPEEPAPPAQPQATVDAQAPATVDRQAQAPAQAPPPPQDGVAAPPVQLQAPAPRDGEAASPVQLQAPPPGEHTSQG